MIWFIRNYDERMSASENKQKKILHFLRDERYTTYQILADHLGLSTQTVRRTIYKMIGRNLVTKVDGGFGLGSGYKIIGLTPNGLSAAFDDKEIIDAPFYSLSKINPLTIQHRLAIQENRVASEKAGWTNWVSESVFKDQPEWKKIGDKQKKRISIPDALVTDPTGNRVAIEIERTAKDPKRYPEILAFHLLSIKREKRYDKVLYLMPDETMKKRIEKLFKNIREVSIDGKKIPIQPGHIANISFDVYRNFT